MAIVVFVNPERGFFMKKILSFGPLFIIITALLWNFDGFLRTTLYSLPPAVIVFYEHFLGAVILVPLSFSWFKDIKKMTRKEWIAISIVAIFSGAFGTILYTAALQKIHFIQFSVVVLLQQQLQPIWAIITAAILLKEPITKRFFGWAALALIAAYFVTFKNMQVNLATGEGTLIAALMAVGAGFMWGSSTAISKYVLNKVSFLTGVALRYYLAPIFALFFVFGQGQSASLFAITTSQWITLLAITFSTGLVALGFYYYGLKRTPARITTLCELVWPAAAVLTDYFYFHKTLSITQWLGIAVLVFAIYQITSPLAGKKAELAGAGEVART